jgi:hypothetical protein
MLSLPVWCMPGTASTAGDLRLPNGAAPGIGVLAHSIVVVSVISKGVRLLSRTISLPVGHLFGHLLGTQ